MNNIQIVTDFDRTLTKAVVNGKPGACSYGVIENSGLLSADYHKKIKECYDYYFPIEIDPHKTIQEKVPFMVEWWVKANGALVNEKISVSLFDTMIPKANLGFRVGVHQFLEFTEKNSLPVLVFSAGVGDLIDKIFVYLEGRLHSNLHVISNRIITDSNGTITGWKDPMIHVFNKNEVALSHDSSSSWFESVSHRKNLILIGDSPGDVGMANGVVDPGEILKIGFFNFDDPVALEKYKTLFDVLILNDGSFKFVLDLLNDISAS
uniref:5'-nucleotidase n=1 Tax=Arcella intermedia TaxID=1963864 RepID=A0A6B2LCX0_9EUKA